MGSRFYLTLDWVRVVIFLGILSLGVSSSRKSSTNGTGNFLSFLGGVRLFNLFVFSSPILVVSEKHIFLLLSGKNLVFVIFFP